MPNRILRDWTDSEAVNKLTCQAEIFFTRLIMKSDDYGRFFADDRMLKASLFPLRINQLRDADLQRWITECVKAGLVRIYEANNKSYLEIVNFGQRLRQAKKRFPDPSASCQQVVSESPPETKRNETESETRNEGEKKPPSVAYSEKIEKPLEEDRFETYQEWTDLILNKQDQFFEAQLIKTKVPFSPEAINDHIELVARYDWKFNSQQKFRISVVKHTKEFIEKKQKFVGGKFQQQPTDLVYVSQVSKEEPLQDLKTITSEQKEQARIELQEIIDADFKNYCENDSCLIKFAPMKMDFLRKYKIFEPTEQQRKDFNDLAVGERIRQLNENYDPVTRITLSHYQTGRFPEGDMANLQAIAKELALRHYFEIKREQQYPEPVESFEPNVEEK